VKYQLQNYAPQAHGILKENRKEHFLERSFFIVPSIEMPKKIPSQIFRWEKIRNSLFSRGAQMPQNCKKKELFSDGFEPFLLQK
jgi:hypothetical protein